MNLSNVLVIGPSNSGKTVLLSSLYHKLSVPGAAGYYLEAPLAQQRLLTHSFATLLRKGWLDATAWGRVDAYDFTVMVKAADGSSKPAITLRYHDMAGGRFMGSSASALMVEAVAEETAAVIKKADIMLALIDGKKLHEFLTRDVVDPDFWLSHLHSICAELSKHNAKDKSLHLILTKWDLFEDTNAELEKAATALLSHAPFRDLVEQCAGRVRLIPVSAVGRVCAEKLDELRKQEGDDTPVVLKRSELPCPKHVEIPFACILPDILERKAKEAIAKAEAEARAYEASVYVEIPWWEKLLGRLGDAVAVFVETRGHWLGAELLRQGARFAQRRVASRQMAAAQLQAENETIARRLRAAVHDETTAIQYVLEIMMQTESNFLDAYPASDLKSFILGVKQRR